MEPSQECARLHESQGLRVGTSGCRGAEGHVASAHIEYETRKTRFYGYEDAWKQTVLRVVDELYERKRAPEILDFGSGRGEFLKLLSQHGYRNIVGADADEKCVDLSGRYATTVLVKRVHDVIELYGEKSFDVVTALHVLEHLENAPEAIRVLARISRKHLIFAVPNLAVPWRVCFTKRERDVNRGHVCGWDFPHFRNLVENVCGLTLVKYVPDVVLVPLISGVLHRCGLGLLVEHRLLPTAFPYLSHSIIAVCEK